MKRLSILIIAACLLISSAAFAEPETRQRTIFLEGMAEEITETRVLGTKGYTIYMDLERYDLLEEDEGGGFDQFVPRGEDAHSSMKMAIDFSGAADYTVEDAVDDMAAVMKDNGYEGIDVSNILDFPDEFTTWQIGGQKDGRYMNMVLIGMEHGIYYANIECPLEAAEGFGMRMLWALYTLEPVILAEGD